MAAEPATPSKTMKHHDNKTTGSLPGRRHPTLLSAMISLFMVALALVSVSCLCIFGTEWHSALYTQGVKFTGNKDRHGNIQWFSVRVGGDDVQVISAECKLEFCWKGRRYPVREIGLDDLAGMGIAPTHDDYGDSGVTKAFVGGNTGKHPDFGVEFYFRNGRLQDFYAWSTGVCPFMISIEGHQPAPLPFDDGQLRKSCGEPDHVVSFPGT